MNQRTGYKTGKKPKSQKESNARSKTAFIEYLPWAKYGDLFSSEII